MYEEYEILPEFSSMSLKPTIGANVIPKLVQAFKHDPDFLTEHGDVPYSIMHGSRQLPLGNYIREKVREGLDLPHDEIIYMDELTGVITTKKGMAWQRKSESNTEIQNANYARE